MRDDFSDDFMATAAQRAATLTTTEGTTSISAANIVASTLYLAGCIAAGLVLHNQGALIFAIVTAGINYLASTVQMVWPGYRMTIITLVALSIALGACAGVSLLWW